MAIISRQIGLGTESNLLYQILKQLNRLTSIMFGLKPNYKVYTALLTQSGGDDPQNLSSGPVTKGVTYVINGGSNGDFSNVGAPSNDDSTWFVAINDEIPNNYGDARLDYNTGAPTVIVLENTIGNIWFTYSTVGIYNLNSDNLFELNKTTSFISGDGATALSAYRIDNYIVEIFTYNLNTLSNEDGLLENISIEIRVYS